MIEDKVKQKKFYLQITLVLLAGLIISGFFAKSASDREKQTLINRVENVSKVLHRAPTLYLSNEEIDIKNGDFEYLRGKMAALKEVNKDAKTVYLLGYRKDRNKLFHFVDSEDKNSSSYFVPGVLIEEDKSVEIDAFIKGQSIARGPYRSESGSVITALAPMFQPGTSKTIAFIGMNIDASGYYKKVILSALYPLLTTLLICFFFIFIYREHTKKYKEDLKNIKIEFSSFMSHEIRDYVTRMKAGLKTLQDEDLGKLAVPQMAFVSELFIFSNEFSRLIEEFLDILKMERASEVPLNMQDNNLIDILKSTVLDMKEMILKKDIVIAYEGNFPEQAFVLCDASKIGRVFSNIIGNALKYSYEKSSVRVGYIDSNNMHTIYIKDSGIGIPLSEQTEIFKKFYRAENARRTNITGTGLGLYLSKFIIKKHNAKIWFESEEGKGTTFFVSIPKSIMKV